MRVFAQEKVQQFLQRHHLRHRRQLTLDPEQIGLRIAHHRHQLLDMNKTERVIEMTTTKRKAGVPRFERFLYVFIKAFLDVQEHDLAPRRHDVANDATPEIKRVHQEIAAQ